MDGNEWIFEHPGVYLIKGIDPNDNEVMEGYLDLPAHTGINKLNKKYTYNSWYDLEDKPFDVTTYPATTYEIAEPFPQDYFVYSSQDGNEQKLYSSSLP